MDRNKTIDLIKAKTLGCLTKDEDTEFKEYMESGEDFPWDVLGEYQNLTAMLPVLLQVEVPDSELKDNVARKLYKIIEELKAKQQAEVTPVPETEAAEVEPESETEQKEEEAFIEEPIKFSADDNSSLDEPDLSTVIAEPSMDLSLAEQDVEEKSKREKPEKIVDEKLERQKTIEYIDTYHKKEMAALERASKKNKLISIILFVISLILLGVIYYLLSTEISSNKEEIENLKIGLNESHTVWQDGNLS